MKDNYFVLCKGKKGNLAMFGNYSQEYFLVFKKKNIKIVVNDFQNNRFLKIIENSVSYNIFELFLLVFLRLFKKKLYQYKK